MADSGTRRVAADLHNLAQIREIVQSRAASLGIIPEVASDKVLAVDEAVTNIIKHGYAHHPGVIEIAVWLEAGTFIVRVRDDAPPFDPMTVPPPDLAAALEQRSLGGLGIYLMRQFTDHITHRVTPQGGNELILKRRNSAGDTVP
jgi:serine/threonine-protein kinase RsbW